MITKKLNNNLYLQRETLKNCLSVKGVVYKQAKAFYLKNKKNDRNNHHPRVIGI